MYKRQIITLITMTTMLTMVTTMTMLNYRYTYRSRFGHAYGYRCRY